jgi:hypothetical protein
MEPRIDSQPGGPVQPYLKYRLAKSISWNRFLGSLTFTKNTPDENAFSIKYVLRLRIQDIPLRIRDFYRCPLLIIILRNVSEMNVKKTEMYFYIGTF